MADVSPGFEQELYDRLAGKYGSQWEDKLSGKWGHDWKEPCSQEMQRTLGYGWESESAERKSEAIEALIDSNEGAAPTSATGSPASPADPDSPAPDLSGSPWIQTLLQADSFEAWLTRIGIDISTLPPRS